MNTNENKWDAMKKLSVDEVHKAFEEDIKAAQNCYKKNLDSFSIYTIMNREAAVANFIDGFVRSGFTSLMPITEGAYLNMYFNFPTAFKAKGFDKYIGCLTVKGSLYASKSETYGQRLSICRVTEVSPYFQGLYNFIYENLMKLNSTFVHKEKLPGPFYGMLIKDKHHLIAKFPLNSKSPLVIVEGFGSDSFPTIGISALTFTIVFETDLKRTTITLDAQNYKTFFKSSSTEVKPGTESQSALDILTTWLNNHMDIANSSAISCYPSHVVMSKSDITEYKLTKSYKKNLQTHNEYDAIKSKLNSGNSSFFVASVKHKAHYNMTFNMSENNKTTAFDNFETDASDGSVTVHMETTSERRRRIDNLLLSFTTGNPLLKERVVIKQEVFESKIDLSESGIVFVNDSEVNDDEKSDEEPEEADV